VQVGARRTAITCRHDHFTYAQLWDHCRRLAGAHHARGRPVSADELVEHCRRLIAGYKLPRHIELRTEPLPKSGAGKILKRELRDRHWAADGVRVGGA
jgi:acyl-CoA synthetase (AMP-forming)/AMP-acid ligase II